VQQAANAPAERKTGAHAPVFFRPRFLVPDISQCGKNFCVVKNRAAWHNQPCCDMENRVS
jgi:hypothetical protein